MNLTKAELLGVLAAILQGANSSNDFHFISLASGLLHASPAAALAAAHLWAGALAQGLSPYWRGHDTPERYVKEAEAILKAAEEHMALDCAFSTDPT